MVDQEKGFKVEQVPVAPAPAYLEDTGSQVLGTSETQYELGFWTRMGCTPESFKRRTLADKHNHLNQTLTSRHLRMIAIGGGIGAGLFVGSGGSLSNGGPATVLIDFAIVGVMIFNVVYALGELAVTFPVSGGFYTYSTRFIDPSWGFAMGWNYVFQWAIVLPIELTVAAIVIGYWDMDTNIGVWITVFLVAIVAINIFGVLGYGEEEFWSSSLKLAAVVIFMIIALVCVLGGGPKDGMYSEYWGARFWYHPGAFRNGFKGLCSVFVTAAFAFSGTELVGLAAAESKTPVQSLPSAVKQIFWRISLFYILALFFVGLLVPYDDTRLLGSGYINVKASPFVIVAKNAGLIGFDHFMNVVILVSVLSIGNSSVYGGSRTLTALAEQGYAPRMFSYVDRAGRPLVSTATIILLGSLAYLNLSASGEDIFDWLLALSGLSALFTWGSICFAHIRFRAAWAYRGHTVAELPFAAAFGVYGSWLGLILVVIILAAQLYVAVFDMDAETFFKSYLAAPIVMFFWVCGYLWKGQGWLKLSQIDVDSGRREIDWEAHNRKLEQRRNSPLWKRVCWKLF
ncbi:amino acid permease [Histoplasma capsulatum var. duboisii H88]|uniref:Amino acid permease n=2 Tax=Ajellomyces capsulatus TaxID=5037 RepID=F0UTG8_AJEC8|nr:amino acid permease [Histoplasma capsulatum H143]EGC49195.1 amino acid permease [Histoplasma capsulatum var. duboisii H88]